MTEIPKPASPLPWVENRGDKEAVMIYSYLRHTPVADLDGCALEDEECRQDRAYILWAANNAPALAARCARLEKALEGYANLNSAVGDAARAALAREQP